jgi:hypothetical protein
LLLAIGSAEDSQGTGGTISADVVDDADVASDADCDGSRSHAFFRMNALWGLGFRGFAFAPDRRVLWMLMTGFDGS